MRRFYDIRGYYGNAWEPTALAKFSEQTGEDVESQSETDSLAQGSSEFPAALDRVDASTALAASPFGRVYCYGTEKGIVSLHSTRSGRLAEIHTSRGFFRIEKMIWSDEGRRLAFSDSSKKVFMVSTRVPIDDLNPVIETETEILMKSSAKGQIYQLLFGHGSDRLLVHSSSAVHMVSIESSTVLHSLDLGTNELKWIQPTQGSGQLLGFGTEAMITLDAELAQVQTYRYDLSASPVGSTAETRIDNALLSSDKKQVLVQMSSQQGKIFYCFQTSSFSTSPEPVASHEKDENAPSLIMPSFLPQDISSQISKALSFVSQNRVLCLSRDFTLYSWQFRTKPGIISTSKVTATTTTS